MNPLEQKVADHILSLILKCDAHQGESVSSLANAYSTFVYLPENKEMMRGSDIPVTPIHPIPLPTVDGVGEFFVEKVYALSTPIEPAPEPPAPAKRTRRTKEQIEADRVAAEAVVTTPAEPEVTLAPSAEPEPEVTTPEEPVDAKALRAEVLEIFKTRKNEIGFKDEFTKFIRASQPGNPSPTLVSLADALLPALIATLAAYTAPTE